MSLVVFKDNLLHSTILERKLRGFLFFKVFSKVFHMRKSSSGLLYKNESSLKSSRGLLLKIPFLQEGLLQVCPYEEDLYRSSI